MGWRRDKVPWYVERRIPPEKVRAILHQKPLRRKPHYTAEEWKQFRRNPRASFPSNTTLPCPLCGRFLYLSYITKNVKAKKLRLSNLWSCYACGDSFFIGDFEERKLDVRARINKLTNYIGVTT